MAYFSSRVSYNHIARAALAAGRQCPISNRATIHRRVVAVSARSLSCSSLNLCMTDDIPSPLGWRIRCQIEWTALVGRVR